MMMTMAATTPAIILPEPDDAEDSDGLVIAGTVLMVAGAVMFVPETARGLPLLARPSLKIAVSPDDPEDSVFALILPQTLPAMVTFGVVTV